MADRLAEVIDDLADEHASLDELLLGLDDAALARATPSPGWSVADQIAHLTYFDVAATTAIVDPDVFADLAARLADAISDRGAEGMDLLTLGDRRKRDRVQMLGAAREARVGLVRAARSLTGDDRVPWYGPSMGAASFVTARLMETWAHGTDIATAVGVERAPTDRLRHIAHLGFITRGWSHTVRGLTPPDGPVHVRLEAPSGGQWSFGDESAREEVSGPAIDFCLVVTQRRHVDDTSLEVVGPAARAWMLHAQAFAGRPTTGPVRGS